MPFTFSTESFTRPLAEFGRDSAQMILQTGATIQQGLQQMMTNRQVSAMGQELGQLNPESPEWAQQAVQLGARYPMAMKSPAGQFMLSTQAKANADWKRMQQAKVQANAVMGRQEKMEGVRHQNALSLEGIRHKNRMEAAGGGMDLSGIGPELPEAAPSMQGMGGMGMIGRGLEMAGAAPQTEEQELGIPLKLGGRGRPSVSPLVNEALTPLAEAKKAVPGFVVKPSQAGSAIAATIGRKQQEKMYEKRADASEEAANRRASEAEKGREATESRMLKGMSATSLRQERTNVNSRLGAVKRELDSSFDEALESIDTDSEGKPKGLSKEQTVYFKKRRALSDELQALSAEYETLTGELKKLEGGKSSETFRFDAATGKLVPR